MPGTGFATRLIDVLETALGLLAVGLCVLANAFFVSAEFSLVTVRHTWVVELSRGNEPRAPAVRRAVEKLDDTIAATQLGITLASIALGWLGEPAVASVIAGPVRMLGLGPAAVHSVAVALSFATITFLHVVLGELAPKAVALGSPETLALRTARPLLGFSRVFSPIIRLMNGAGNLVVRALGFVPASAHARAHSVGELKMLVEETQDAGTLDPVSAEVASRVLDLTMKQVCDAMVPKAWVATLDLEMSEKEVVARIWDTQFTRMPVWSRRRRRWIGVANVKMLLLRWAATGHLRLRDAIYVPLTLTRATPLARALRLFRRRKQHLAFVVTDDGAQIGVVTLEDVLEQMVGAIDDETDMPEGAVDTRMSRASLEKAERPSLV